MRRAIPLLVVFSLMFGVACLAAPQGKGAQAEKPQGKKAQAKRPGGKKARAKRPRGKKPAAKKHEEGPEVVSPSVAAKDPDFHVEGEYVGQWTKPDGSQQKLGAQVVARGKAKFEIYLLDGGLPGEGWKKGDKRVQVTGTRDGQVTTIEGDSLAGEIQGGTMTLHCNKTGAQASLARVERTSPTLGAQPPKGAKVLFGAGGADDFEDPQLSEDGNLVAGTTTKDKFNSYRLHIEFRLSWKPQATGQARSNSGVYLFDCYEVQVLDSFGLEGADNECGGLYKVKEPDVNMCLPPLVWQTYDIDFTAPGYDAAGKKTRDARLTVRQNGVLIHDDVDLPHDTPGREKEGPGPRPLHLQSHNNHVEYRNIWLVPR